MRVTLEYFGQAREATGVGHEEIDFVPPCTAEQLVLQLAGQRGGRFASLLVNGTGVSPGLLLAINDHQISDPSATVLREGDHIAIIPPVSGGSSQ